MKKQLSLIRYVLLSAMLAAVVPHSADAQGTSQKLAQTGMKFLSVGVSARQAALADAFTASDGYSASLFYNPAGMARLGSAVEASIGQVNWIADIKHTYGSVAFSPASGDYGVFGVNFQYVNYGDIEATILAPNKQNYIDVGTFRPNALTVGVGYARALTDKFSVGANVKWVKQDLGDGIVQVIYSKDITDTPSGIDEKNQITNKLDDIIAFDFGVMYRTGFKSLALGMAVRNFSREVKFQKEGFQLPLTFRLGMSMNVLDLFEMDQASQSLLLSVDAEHPRDYPEQIKVGAEYVFMNTVALRVGYVNPADEHSLSYGVGLQHELSGTQFGLDYAYTPFGVFDNVQRLSLRFGF